jgi:alkylation response protein AidB-like acyl-CoA dehydrogenase
LPIESYKDLADAGLLALTVPLRHGGKEFSPLAFSAAMIELGQGDPNVANTVNMHYVVLWFLRMLATVDQQALFFPSVVKEGQLFAASTSEPDIRWDDPAGTALSTTIKPSPGGYLVKGEKWRTSMAHSASYYCVAAVLDGKTTKDGMVIALVPHDASGVVVKDDWTGPMMWATDSCSVEFNCLIPAGHVIGAPGALPHSGLFPLFALGYSSFYLGMGLSGFLAFLQEYGTVELNSIIGNMALRLNRALVILSRAAVAWQVQDKTLISIATAQAKAYCPEAAYQILNEINTIVGGETDPFHRLLIDAMASRFLPPNPELVATRIGEALRLGEDPKFLEFR